MRSIPALPKCPLGRWFWLDKSSTGIVSALDYLIGCLAELDSGPARRRTQFPAESSSQLFRDNAARHLNGLSAIHVARIEKLQPYNGCDWTKRLTAMSNLDKHNALIPTKLDFLYSGILEPIKSTKIHPSRYRVRMYIEPTVFVAAGQGFKLIDALREIEVGVTQTLDAFKPEFK